jgi:hypothetical protein
MSTDLFAFATRARAEAARYGSDPWVFVRELVQNARDAGATRIDFQVETGGGVERVRCRDDGDGLTLEEARRYLFALYASSKRARSGHAGRFGVGFWSILRFEPERIVVDSASLRGPAWAVELDGGLTRARAVPPTRSRPGTAITLERPASDPALRRRVADAVRQSSRDLRELRRPDRRVRLLVDGSRVDRGLGLPPPARAFARGPLRGAVGLGSAPGVELFSRGLRVRSAAVLSDLLGEGGTARSRVRFPELVDGLAPCAQLEGGDLDLTMARSDALDSPGLRRLVRLARREVGRLLEGQLERADPRPRLRRALDGTRAPLLAAAAASAVVLGLLVALQRPRPASRSATAPPPSGETAGPRAAGYRDLAAIYAGPSAHAGSPSPERDGPLRYAPAVQAYHFGALRIAALDGDGRATRSASAPRPAPPLVCAGECLDVEIDVADGPGPLRLPVPAGHAVEPDSARFAAGLRPGVHVTPEGEWLVELPFFTRDSLRYRTGPAPVTPPPATAEAPGAPAELADAARRLLPLPLAERVPAAERWVAERVAYSLDPDVAARYAELASPFLERALEVGAGDCDVQNAVLLSLVSSAGLDARLAVGYVGREGRGLPDLHAWVEYRDPDSGWLVADASRWRRSPVVPAGSLAVSPPVSAPSRRWPVRGIGIAAVAALALVALAAAAGRMRRGPQPPVDLPALLRGALQRPQSFEGAPGVFHRPILPLVGGGRTTLARAWDLAHRGRLFLGAGPDPLAGHATRGGGEVLDASTAAGNAVGEMLGALPLQDWPERMRAARETALTRLASEHLARTGAAWQVRYAGSAARPGLLDLSPSCRHVLIDPGCRVLAAAEQAFPARPAAALLAALSHVCALASIGPERRRLLLAPLAADALRER